jgi:hypothetical protein
MATTKAIRAWITSHRCQTAFHVYNGMVIIKPTVATIPLFCALGLGKDGPQKGKPVEPLNDEGRADNLKTGLRPQS